MQPTPFSDDNVHEYPPLPSALQDSPEWEEARQLNELAQIVQGRLTLGCFTFWLSDGGYLVTGPPPMGDMRGGRSWMIIYTPEHLIRIDGNNLHQLAWVMKQQRVDDLRVSELPAEVDDSTWVITSTTATERDED